MGLEEEVEGKRATLGGADFVEGGNFCGRLRCAFLAGDGSFFLGGGRGWGGGDGWVCNGGGWEGGCVGTNQVIIIVS